MSAVADPRRCFPSEPLADDDSEAVVAFAVNDLVLLRSPMWSGDAGAVLHVLASLGAELDRWLPDAVADAISRGYSSSRSPASSACRWRRPGAGSRCTFAPGGR